MGIMQNGKLEVGKPRKNILRGGEGGGEGEGGGGGEGLKL